MLGSLLVCEEDAQVFKRFPGSTILTEPIVNLRYDASGIKGVSMHGYDAFFPKDFKHGGVDTLPCLFLLGNSVPEFIMTIIVLSFVNAMKEASSSNVLKSR